MASEKEKQLKLRAVIKQARAEGRDDIADKAQKMFDRDKAKALHKDVTRIPGVTEKIDTTSEIARIENVTEKIKKDNSVQKITPIDEWQRKIKMPSKGPGKRAATKIAKKAARKLPGILGFLASVPALLKPTEAEAAVGDMFGAESMGSDPAIEDPRSPEYKARQRMLKLKHRKKR